jgi:hypothetical protein
MQLIKRIENLAQGLSALVSEGDNDAVTASSASSLADQQQTVVSDEDMQALTLPTHHYCNPCQKMNLILRSGS